MFIWCYLLLLHVKKAQFTSSCYLEETDIRIGSPITGFEIWFQFNFDFQKQDSNPYSTNIVRMYSNSTDNLFSLSLRYELSKVMQLIEYKISDQASIQVSDKYLTKWSQLIYKGDQMIIIDFKFDDVHAQHIQNQSIIDNFKLLLTPKIKGKLLKHKICFVQGVPILQNKLNVKNDLILVNELLFSQKFSNQYLTIRGWFKMFSHYENKLFILDNMQKIMTISIQLGQMKILYQLGGEQQQQQYELGFQLNWFYFVFQQIFQSNENTANRVTLFQPFGIKNDHFITKDKFSFDINIKINFQSLFQKDLQIFDLVKTELISFMCPPDCEYCVLNMICQQCKQGRQLINGICYCNDPIKQNVDECKYMSQIVNIDQQTYDCPEGYQVCGSYVSCSYGYYQVNNKCRECPSFEGEMCQECIDNPRSWNNKQSCYSQKRFLDSFFRKQTSQDSDYMIEYNQVQQRQIQFKQKKQKFDQRYDICKFGYFYREKQCLNCPFGCKKCSYSKIKKIILCDICQMSFHYDHNLGKCILGSQYIIQTQLCLSLNCKVCFLSNIKECYQCKTGYYLNIQTRQCQNCRPSIILNRMSNIIYYMNDLRYIVVKNLTDQLKQINQNSNSLQIIEETMQCNFNYVQENNQIDILLDQANIGCKTYTVNNAQMICQQAFEPTYKLNNYFKKAIYCPNNTFCAKFIIIDNQLKLTDEIQIYNNLNHIIQNLNLLIFEYLTVQIIEIELQFQEGTYQIDSNDLKILESDIYLENIQLYLTIQGQNTILSFTNQVLVQIGLYAYDRIQISDLKFEKILKPLIFVMSVNRFIYQNIITTGQISLVFIERINHIEILNSTYNGQNNHNYSFIKIERERQYQFQDLFLENTDFIKISDVSKFSIIEIDQLSILRMDLQNSQLINFMGSQNSLNFTNVKMNYVSLNRSQVLNLHQSYLSSEMLQIGSIFATQSSIIRFSHGCLKNISLDSGSLVASSFIEIYTQLKLDETISPGLRLTVTICQFLHIQILPEQCIYKSNFKIERFIFANNTKDCLFQLISQILEVNNIRIQHTFGLSCQFRIDSPSIMMNNYQSFNNQITSNQTDKSEKIMSIDYILKFSGFNFIKLEDFKIQNNQIEAKSYLYLNSKLKNRNTTLLNFKIAQLTIPEAIKKFIFLPINIIQSLCIVVKDFKILNMNAQKTQENVLISLSSISNTYIQNFEVRNTTFSNSRFFEINGTNILIDDIIMRNDYPQSCQMFYILCQNLILRNIQINNFFTLMDPLFYLESSSQVKSKFTIRNISQVCLYCQQQSSTIYVYLSQRDAFNKISIERIIQVGLTFMFKEDQSMINFKVPSKNYIRITNIILVGSALTNGYLFFIDSNFESQVNMENMLIFFDKKRQNQSGILFYISKTPSELNFIRISQNPHNFLIAQQVQSILISNILVTQIYLERRNFMSFLSQKNNEPIQIKLLNVALHGQTDKIYSNSLLYINQDERYPVQLQLNKIHISNITQTQHILLLNNTNQQTKLIIKDSVFYRSKCIQMCFETGNQIQLFLTVISHFYSFNNICNGLLNLYSEKVKINEIILNNKVEGRIQVIIISNNLKIRNQEILQQQGLGLYQKSIEQHQIDLEIDSEYGLFLEFASCLVLSFDYGISYLPNSKQRLFQNDTLIDLVQVGHQIEAFYLPSGQSLKNYQRLNMNRLAYEQYLNPLRVFALSNDKQLLNSRLFIQCYVKNDRNFSFGPFTLGQDGKQLDELILYQNPYQNESITYSISCDLLNIEYQNDQHKPKISSNYSLQFKIKTFKCQLGEIFINNGCQLCDSKAFQYSVDKIGQVCKHISNQIVMNLQPGLLQLQKGYWRPDYYNDKIELCYDQWNYCDGGYQVGDPTCQPGYIGPLCLQCDLYNKRGFGYFGTKNQQCSICNDGYQNYAYILLSIIWQVFSVSLTCRSLHFMSQQHRKLMSSSPLYSVLNKTQIDQITIILKQFQNFILLILFINSREFQLWKYINYVIYFFTNPLNVQSNQMECLIKQFGIDDNFTQIKLGLQLQFPLLILLIFYLMYGFAVKVIKIQFQWLFITQSLIIVYIFNQIGLYSQTVSMVSYSTFSDIKWMNADLSIQFYDDDYRNTLYVSASVICIFLLIPIIMLMVLYRNRNKLLRSRQFGNFSYLFREYKLKYYYWEILQMFFTLSFISATKVLQDYLFPKQLLQILIILTYVYLLMSHQPYKLIILNRSEIKFKLILIISILLVMMIQSTKNSSLNLSIYLLLYLINIISIGRVLRFLIMKCLQQYSQAVDQVKEKITQTFPRLQSSQILKPQKQLKDLARQRFQNMYQSVDKIRDSIRSSSSSNRNIRLSNLIQSDVLTYRQPPNESSQSIQIPINESLSSSISRNSSILKNNLKQKEIELSALRQKK
ncbi:hypothetical protein pb186bvf_008613 [Paramecium bursaria]